MVNDRAPGRCVLWVTQPLLGACVARVNDCNPSVVPGTQLMVTAEHAGTTSRLTSPNGGASVVVVGGGVVVVVGGVGVSSSVVVTSRVRSATLS